MGNKLLYMYCMYSDVPVSSFQVYYAKFPPQIEKRQILLLHPVLGKLVGYMYVVTHYSGY